MEQIPLILTCLVLGVLLRLSGRLPDNTPKVLGGWVINVVLPAVALRRVHDVEVNSEWVLAAASCWIGVALALVVMIPLAKLFGWTRQRLGALLLVTGWGNTSFVGLPMISAYYGDAWLSLGLFIDLFGSYLSLSILGITIASVCAYDSVSWKALAKRIATFPPFLAIVIALATNHVERPKELNDLLDAIGATLTPLALAAVGFALRIGGLPGRITPLGIGLLFRLGLAPLAITLLMLALSLRDTVAQVTIFEMAMPPMLGASIIALDHDLEPELVSLLIGIGIPLSMLTAPAWSVLIAGLL